jgi:hypothetical protein
MRFIPVFHKQIFHKQLRPIRAHHWWTALDGRIWLDA